MNYFIHINCGIESEWKRLQPCHFKLAVSKSKIDIFRAIKKNLLEEVKAKLDSGEFDANKRDGVREAAISCSNIHDDFKCSIWSKFAVKSIRINHWSVAMPGWILATDLCSSQGALWHDQTSYHQESQRKFYFGGTREFLYNRNKYRSNQSCTHGSTEQIETHQDGATPLICAVQNRHKKVVDLLLGSAADVNLGVEDGVVPLYSAAQEGSRTLITWLVQAKAALDHRANVRLAS